MWKRLRHSIVHRARVSARLRARPRCLRDIRFISNSTSICNTLRVAALFLACALTLTPAASTSASASPPPHLDADVLIQAGHEGRPDCNVEPARLCNNTGAAGEIRWTPITADAATRALRAAGISVLREPAHIAGPYHVRIAIFIHFDGSSTPCASGPSLGYPTGALRKLGPHSEAAAKQWHALYGAVIPFRFQPDNFTPHLRDYYGYHRAIASDASLVIEGSELSCPAQRRWQAAHLLYEGRLIAYFVSRRLGNSNVLHP